MMINVKTYDILTTLLNKEENEIALVEDEQKLYIYKETEWVEYKPEEGGLKISLMELNSLLVDKLPVLEDLKKSKRLIKKYVNKHSNYYMLLNNDLHYYTVFHIDTNSEEKIADVVIECLQSLGEIKSIDKNAGGVIECWITLREPHEATYNSYPLYFFDYTEGVITCKV